MMKNVVIMANQSFVGGIRARSRPWQEVLPRGPAQLARRQRRLQEKSAWEWSSKTRAKQDVAIHRAQRLLDEASGHLESAITAFDESDIIRADDHLIHVLALLPEL